MNPGLLEGLLSRGPPTQTVARLQSALDEHVDSDEQMQYRLPGAGVLVHESDGESHETGEDGSLAVVTDHRVLFAAVDNGATVFDIPHSQVGAAALDSGLFRTVLTVEHRQGGRYQFRPAGGNVVEAVEYIGEASNCWQFVDTLLEELEGHADRIETALEAGAFDRVQAVLAAAGETTDELDERVRAAGLWSALGHRVDAARQDLQRARVRTRRELARSLVAEAESRHLDCDTDIDYTGAYERYDRAREQLLRARSIAAEHGLDTEGVEGVLANLEDRVDLLAAQPVGLAKQATERALGTDDPAVRVEMMRVALDRSHEALTAGWGTALGRRSDREALRFRVALLADGLVEARRTYAAALETAGDELADEGNTAAACKQYTTAREELMAALDTAHEFRTPDPDLIEQELSRIRWKHQVAQT